MKLWKCEGKEVDIDIGVNWILKKTILENQEEYEQAMKEEERLKIGSKEWAQELWIIRTLSTEFKNIIIEDLDLFKKVKT